MADRVKGKIIPKKSTTFQQRQPSLKDNEWAVFTNDEMIQNGISSFLAEKGEGSCTTGEIYYNGKKTPVFFVPFCVVEFLKRNRANNPNYVSFHRKPRSGNRGTGTQYGIWRMWMEGKKSPNRFLIQYFENWGKN